MKILRRNTDNEWRDGRRDTKELVSQENQVSITLKKEKTDSIEDIISIFLEITPSTPHFIPFDVNILK